MENKDIEVMEIENKDIEANKVNKPATFSKENIVVTLTLSLRALGVIYGDLGTSPLYVVSSFFQNPPASNEDIIACSSLAVWCLLWLVTFKYVVFILLADNDGEGGTFALYSLLTGSKSTLKYGRAALTIAAIFGASFIISDGALTPAISVLSAIEGIGVYDAALMNWVVPLTVIVLIILFMAQRFGTSKIGFTFGPIILIWFASIFSLGVYNIHLTPEILYALDPSRGVKYLVNNGANGFFSLGSVFLAVTGVEAMYADLGHFRASSVRISWLCVALPALISNYLGQGAALLANPTLYATIFYSSVPTSCFWPMFVISVAATIIASQAIITGCFSLISQAISLGLAPPLFIAHKSEKFVGQIYISYVNYPLMLITIFIVIGFGTSTSIGNAYGVTVSGIMFLTTCLYMMVMRFTWHLALWKVLPFFVFLFVDSFFFAANITKVPNGGWVPLFLGIVFGSIMIAWHFGERAVENYLSSHTPLVKIDEIDKWLKNQAAIPLLTDDSFLSKDQSEDNLRILAEKRNSGSKDQSEDNLSALAERRNSGPKQTTDTMGIFLTPTIPTKMPLVFQAIASRIRCVPKITVFLVPEKFHIPKLEEDQRYVITKLDTDIYQMILRRGFCESKLQAQDYIKKAKERNELPNIPSELTTFYTLRIEIRSINKNYFKKFWYSYYAFLKKIFSKVDYNLRIPVDSTIEIGIKVPL